MDRTLIIIIIVVAALLGLFLIMKPSPTPPAPPTPVASINAVTVVAHDYSFDAPDVIPAGMTTFELLNQGQELHHVTLFRLEGGHTLADVEAALQTPEPPDWLIAVGGPNAAIAGGSANATLDLQPGNYVIICVIPSPDGVPHVAKGMIKVLTVTPSQSASVAELDADVVIELADYSFILSKPITAGRHTIQVINHGPQDHEVVFFKLASGKTPEDFMAATASFDFANWPGEFWGGVSTMAKGQVNYLTAHFTPGNYLLLCFVPDVADGAPHIAHGMMQMITVE